MFEQNSDQQATHAPVAIQIRMNGFKLSMNQSYANQNRQVWGGCVYEPFKFTQQVRDLLGRCGNKYGIAWACAANPIL